MQLPIVRALDVGYGNVKFVEEQTNAAAAPKISSFPSLTIVSTNEDLTSGTQSRRNTVRVEVNGNNYEVGYDIMNNLGANDEGSALEAKFCLTDGYMARTLGALHYMRNGLPGDKNVIDYLICGLPVSAYKAYKNELQAKMKGTFDLPFGNTMTVNNCIVVPQPLGAYYYYMYEENGAMSEPLEDYKNVNNLIIDVGYYTFDWLVSKGMKGNDNRSGAVFRGMSQVIKAMAQEVVREHKNTVDLRTASKILDEAFREGRIPHVFGKPLDVKQYLKKADGIINEALTQLVASVGNAADITNIMVAGGGSEYFMSAIKSKFPHHEVKHCANPIYSNVIGFQYAGLITAISQQRNQTKSTLKAAENV